jgi:uncharacterized membrane protein
MKDKTRVNKMNRKQFTICGILITASTGAVIGWSINEGNAVLPAVAVIAGAVLLYLCKTRVTEVMEDERIHRVGEKAARKTFQVFTITTALTGTVLIALRNKYPQFEQIGSVLMFCLFTLMVLYMVFYAYYNSRGDF